MFGLIYGEKESNSKHVVGEKYKVCTGQDVVWIGKSLSIEYLVLGMKKGVPRAGFEPVVAKNYLATICLITITIKPGFAHTL